MVPTTKPIADFHRQVTAHAGRTIRKDLACAKSLRTSAQAASAPKGYSRFYLGMLFGYVKNITGPLVGSVMFFRLIVLLTAVFPLLRTLHSVVIQRLENGGTEHFAGYGKTKDNVLQGSKIKGNRRT